MLWLKETGKGLIFCRVQSGPNVLPLPTVSKRLSKEDALSVAMSSEVVAAVCGKEKLGV